MNAPQTTARRHRGALALVVIVARRAGRRHATRAAVIARQLDVIAPGTVRVRIAPVRVDRDGRPRIARHVVLLDALGLPVFADRAAHRAALGLLDRLLPGTDWTHPRAYDTRTGRLTPDAPAAPAELGLELETAR